MSNPEEDHRAFGTREEQEKKADDHVNMLDPLDISLANQARCIISQNS